MGQPGDVDENYGSLQVHATWSFFLVIALVAQNFASLVFWMGMNASVSVRNAYALMFMHIAISFILISGLATFAIICSS